LHASAIKIFILGLDGLEYNFVREWNLRNLKQQEYGKILVPIDKSKEVPLTPQVWAAFLTGKYIPSLYFVHPLTTEMLLKMQSFLRFLRKFIRISLGLGKKIKIKAPNKFPNLKEKTFIDLTKSIEINAPYYSYDGAVFNILNQFYLGKLTLKECIEAMRALYEMRKEQILLELEKIRDVDVVFAYMHFFYADLDNYVSVLKSRVEVSLFLIISDHGFDLETKNHSMHGFYSSNVPLNPKPQRITDFYDLIVNRKIIGNFL